MGEPTHHKSESKDRQAQKKERGPERPTAIQVGQKCPLTAGSREGEVKVGTHFPSVKLAPTPLNKGSLPSAPEKPLLREPNSTLIIKNLPAARPLGSAGFPPSHVIFRQQL